MKLTAVLLTLFCLQVAARSDGQTVTLKVKDASLKEVFRAIQKQTGMNILVNETVLSKAGKVTLEVNNMPVPEVLKLCLKNEGLTYRIIDNTIVVDPSSTGVFQPPVSIKEELPLPPIDVKGRVVNEKEEAVEGASVQIKGSKTKGTSTDANGYFELKGVEENATLVISGVNIETFEVRVAGRTDLAILSAKTKITEGEVVTVEVNTGYQKLPKERATGSFGFVDKEQLNRKAGPDIISRLEGVTTGILFDRRGLPANESRIDQNSIQVRGISTLTPGMQTPLIILNNFPYEGDINGINPNDIESITILKDAAAASIWGARAANGVLVITTKQGQYNRRPQVALNTNFTFVGSPNLFKYPRMTSSEFIEVETFLFNNGFYDGDITNTFNYPSLTPVVEILDNRRNNLISAQDSAAQINALKAFDVRNDFDKYIYRSTTHQQYALNVSGGGPSFTYMLSGGFDKNPNILVGNQISRATFFSNTSVQVTSKLNLNVALNYNNSASSFNALGNIGSRPFNYYFGSRTLYPYARLADMNGLALPIAKEYRTGFTDTAGGGRLLNWQWKPLDEIRNADNEYRQQETVLNVGLDYQLFRSLHIQGNYQYQGSNSEARSFFSDQTYYARNLINLYSQINGNNVTRAIPNGGILDLFKENSKSHIGRLQLQYNQSFSDKHQISSLAGVEIRERIVTGSENRTYGFNEQTLLSTPVDYISDFLIYGNMGVDKIPYINQHSKRTDHFVSAYGNAAYTYDKRYTVSGSFRRDASNLFGIDLRDKWKPFWTVGFAWNISNESFYKSTAIPNLRLRGSFGYQGNVNNSIAPYTILNISPTPYALNNLPRAFVRVPANPGLSWETIRQLNLGLEFQTKNERLSGTFEFYHKRSDNLLLGAANDPTSGINNVTKNSASMSGKGVEASLNILTVRGPGFKWASEIGYTYVTNKVVDYKLNDIGFTASTYATNSGLFVSPNKGNSPYGLFSYPFAGLDASGNPMGYNGKLISTNYQAIFNQKRDTANLIYHGSSIPTHFGYLNNVFTYKDLSLIVAVNYSLGYYFRKSTISYSDLFDKAVTHPDFAKRWQNPGDENTTTVPSMIYPVNDGNRDLFYTYSSANVLRGDNVRLQYIKIGYDIKKSGFKKLPVKEIHIYSVINNIGIIWRSNKEGLDPDIDSGRSPYPVPRSVTVGINISF